MKWKKKSRVKIFFREKKTELCQSPHFWPCRSGKTYLMKQMQYDRMFLFNKVCGFDEFTIQWNAMGVAGKLIITATV